MIVEAPVGGVSSALAGEHERHRRQRAAVGDVELGPVERARPLVDRPGRLVGEQPTTVDEDGQVCEAVLHGLERADGHAELLTGHDVVDPEAQGGVGDADQRRGGEHLPAVEHGLELRRRAEDAAVAVAGRAVGERAPRRG